MDGLKAAIAQIEKTAKSQKGGLVGNYNPKDTNSCLSMYDNSGVKAEYCGIGTTKWWNVVNPLNTLLTDCTDNATNTVHGRVYVDNVDRNRQVYVKILSH